MTKHLFAALALVLLAVGQASAPVAAQPSAPAHRQGEHRLDWPQQESDLRADPAVRYGKLPNGMRYAIMVNQTPTHAASVRLRFDVGSLMEDDDQQGLAHLLEHMAFNGSEHVPEGEMVRTLERHGLAFGADTNAGTSFDQTVYQLEAPTVDDETIGTVFFMLREIASRLTIAPEAVDRERGVVLSEERSRNTPAYRAQKTNWAYMFPSARFPTRWPIGTTDVIQHATAQRIRDLYETYYRPERAFFVVVGDVDADAIEARIRSTFGDWQAARPDHPDPDLGQVVRPSAPSGYFYDPGLSTAVSLSVVRQDPQAPDNRDRQLHNLLRSFGNAILTRRLTTLSRQPGARFQGGGAGWSPILETADIATVSLSSRPEDWQAALSVADQELRRALRYGFTQPELDEQLSRFRTGLRTAVAGASTRRNRALADELVGEFGRWAVFTSPADDLALMESFAPQITPEAVSAAFREEWGRQDPIAYLSTNQEVPNAQAQIASTLAASRRVAVTPPAATSTQSFAYTSFGTPGTVAETHTIDDLGITQIRFANNVRLNIKHTDFARDSVLISVRVGGGLLELPKSQPGLSGLFSAFRAGGLQAHSADDLQRLLAGHTIQTTMGAGADAFDFSGATTPEDLQLELQLLAAYLTAPGYREEGLTQYRQSLQASYQTLDATPNGVAAKEVARRLRSGDPRYGVPPLNDLLARNFDELRAALSRASTSGAIEIGIVGDVDVAAATNFVAATFGALPPREAATPAFAEARALTFPQGTPHPVVLRHSGQANRALAQVYWPATDDSDVRRVRTLDLLRSVLQLKLIDRVREAESATYSPSAQGFYSHVSPGYGYLGVSLDLVPTDVDRFFGVVDDIAASMAAGQISADELERARRPILDEFQHSLENNGYWLRLAATAQTDPTVIARHRSVVADYQAVTPADLRAAAAAYLRADKAYRIAILPPETAPVTQPAPAAH